MSALHGTAQLHIGKLLVQAGAISLATMVFTTTVAGLEKGMLRLPLAELFSQEQIAENLSKIILLALSGLLLLFLEHRLKLMAIISNLYSTKGRLASCILERDLLAEQRVYEMVFPRRWYVAMVFDGAAVGVSILAAVMIGATLLPLDTQLFFLVTITAFAVTMVATLLTITTGVMTLWLAFQLLVCVRNNNKSARRV